jgi:hypothetical protein
MYLRFQQINPPGRFFMLRFTLLACLVALPVMAKETSPITLELISAKESYPWPSDKKPADYTTELENIQKAIKEKMPIDELPKVIPVEFKMKLTNTSEEEVTIFVEGDPNTATLNVKGPSVFELSPPIAFTLEFRLPKAVKLEPGKSHEITIKQLSDGLRGRSRWIFWSQPGEYTIDASYQLADAKGGKGALLKSKAIKVKVEEPK